MCDKPSLQEVHSLAVSLVAFAFPSTKETLEPGNPPSAPNLLPDALKGL